MNVKQVFDITTIYQVENEDVTEVMLIVVQDDELRFFVEVEPHVMRQS